MISVLYTIILITNFKLIEMCIKSSSAGEGAGGEALLGVSRYLLPSPFGEGLGVRLYMPCPFQHAPCLQFTLYRL